MLDDGGQVAGEAYAERDDACIPDPYAPEPDTYDLPPDPYVPEPDPCHLAPDTSHLTPAALWAQACERLRHMVGPLAYVQDFSDMCVLGMAADEVVLGCRTLAQRSRIEDRHMVQVRRVLGELLGVPTVRVQVLLYRP